MKKKTIMSRTVYTVIAVLVGGSFVTFGQQKSACKQAQVDAAISCAGAVVSTALVTETIGGAVAVAVVTGAACANDVQKAQTACASNNTGQSPATQQTTTDSNATTPPADNAPAAPATDNAPAAPATDNAPAAPATDNGPATPATDNGPAASASAPDSGNSGGDGSDGDDDAN